MNKSIRTFFFLLLLGQAFAFAQPSFTVSVTFKFFEKDKPLTSVDFNKLYQIHSTSRNRNDSVKYRYEEKNKTFTIGESVVYNDLIIEIVSRKDTMKLVFQTQGGTKHQFNIEHLAFQEGVFIVKETNLDKLDFKNNRSNYYNYLLSSINEQTFQQKNNQLKKELDRMKLIYGLDDDDYEPKNEKELIAISTRQDAQILKKYKDYLTKKNFINHTESDKMEDGTLIYAPDKEFKIFVFKGESCGANCHSFYNSFLHFNLDKKVPTAIETNFYSIDSIVKMEDKHYIVFHSGYDGGGIYIEEHKMATLLSFNNHLVNVGKFTLSNMNQSNKSEKEIKISAKQSEMVDGNAIGLKFNPQNKILEYNFFITNPNTNQKKKYSGKLMYDKGLFRWLSKSG